MGNTVSDNFICKTDPTKANLSKKRKCNSLAYIYLIITERKGTKESIRTTESMGGRSEVENKMAQHMKRQSYFEKLGIDNGSQVQADEYGDMKLRRSNSNSNMRMSSISSTMIMSKIQIGSITNDSILQIGRQAHSPQNNFQASMNTDNSYLEQSITFDQNHFNQNKLAQRTKTTHILKKGVSDQHLVSISQNKSEIKTQSTAITIQNEDQKNEGQEEEAQEILYGDVLAERVESFVIPSKDQDYQMSFLFKNKEERPIIGKSHDRIRNIYLSKLAYQKLWVSPKEKPKTHQTCIIFDWDDTILCTSFLAPYPSLLQDPNKKIPNSLLEGLEILDQAAEIVLKMAKRLGIVYIITNAAEGWVEMSSERFLPRVCKEIESGITIISARTKYEKLYPHNYQEWKIQAFLEAQQVLENEALTNIIAIGDNNVEIEAAYNLASQYRQAFIKTIKFRESPTIQELCKQIRLVTNQFEQIVITPKNLTVRLQRFGKSQGDDQSEESETIKQRRKVFLQKQKTERITSESLDQLDPIENSKALRSRATIR